jgi:toxin ParE1/3/4
MPSWMPSATSPTSKSGTRLWPPVFLAAIDRTVEGLALQPLKARLRRFRGRDLRHIRSWRVDEFENYLIFYRAASERLEVLRIKHGAMDFRQALRRKE